MLEDVLRAVRATRLRWRVVVATDSRAIARLARSRGAGALLLRARGARATATAALRAAQDAGCRQVLVLPADLPLARAADLRRVIAAGERADVVAVPDRRRSGTNSLLLRPPLAIAPRFGRDSFASHLAAARARGLRARSLAPTTLRLDVDTPEDLALLLIARRAAGPRTREALRSIGASRDGGASRAL